MPQRFEPLPPYIVMDVEMDAGVALGAEALNLEPASLVARARSGDVDAFAGLMAKHERQVFRLAYRLTGNVEDAKDVAQDVFLKLHRSLGALDEARELTPWLYRVTVNAVNDLLRKRRPAESLPEIEMASSHPTPERDLLDAERRRLAFDALAQLPFERAQRRGAAGYRRALDRGSCRSARFERGHGALAGQRRARQVAADHRPDAREGSMNDRIPELDILAGPVQGEEAALAEVRAGSWRQIRRRPRWPVWLAAAAMVLVALLAGWFARG